MAEQTEPSNEASPHPNDHNIIADLTALKKAIIAYEKKGETLLKLKGEYMASCKSVREDMKNILQTAKDKGVNKRALKTLLSMREQQRRMDQTVADLDEDIAAEYEAYVDAVGQWSLPL